jgi:hypothetical protein
VGGPTGTEPAVAPDAPVPLSRPAPPVAAVPPPPLAAATATTATTPPSTDRRHRPRRRSHGGASHANEGATAPGCSVGVGSQPWAELWIDGKTTKHHTPYSEPIACGAHKLRFVREDLGIEKTVSITVHPGGRFKKIVRLEKD